MDLPEILDSLTDPVAVLSHEGDITFLNATAVRFLGGEPAELVGRNLWTLRPEAVGSAFQREFLRAASEQTPGSLETYWPRHEAWLDFRFVPSPGDVTVIGRNVTDRHRMQGMIRRTEEWQQLAMQAVNIGVWDWDIAAQRLTWSPGMWTLLGLPRDSFDPTPDRWNPFIHPDDRERILLASERMLAESGEFDHEYRLLLPSGEVIWVLSLGRVHRNQAGEAVRLLGIIVDISARKRSERALAASEARYHFATEALPQIIWRSTASGEFLECNRHWYAYTGMSEEEMLDGTSWSRAIHPDDRGQFRSQWIRHREAGLEYEFEYRLRRAQDGAYRWHLGRATPIRDGTGAVVQWIGTATDIQDLREATERVRRSEELYRAVIEQAGEGFWLAGPDGTCLEVNSTACEMLGYSREQLLGRNLRELFHPEDQEMRAVDLQRAREGETVRAERRLRRKEGDYLLVEGAARVLEGERALVFFHDVTERRRAEDELRRRELEFRAIFEMAAVGVAQAELGTGRFLRVNPRMCELTGYTEQELLARSFFEVTHPDDRSSDVARVAPVAQGECDGWAAEKRYLRKDGSVIWVQVDGRLIRDQRGHPAHTLAIVQDITEARTAHQTLIRTNRALRDAQRMAQLGSWVLDLRSGEAWWSEQMYRLFGLTPAAFTPSLGTFLEYIHPDDRSQVRDAIEAALAVGASFEGLELRLIRPDGTFAWFVAQGEVEHGAEGMPVYLRGACLDITTRKLLELELQQRAEALAEEARRKDEFLAMLAHELRNPLAPIAYAAEILRSRHDDPAAVLSHRETIAVNARHLARLVDDLLEVSRINQGKIELHQEAVELGAVVGQAVVSAHAVLEQRGHELSLALPSEPIYLHADPVRIVQILVNLLSNAAKYTDRGGRIEVTVEREGPRGIVRVRDNGRGIGPSLLPRIFDLFVQGERSEARTEGGLGIGLTLSRRLAEMHGGALTARSDGPGRGSEFMLRLPQCAPTPPAQPEPEARVVRSDGLRILVVEDNRDAAETLGELLELWGHEARIAHDGPAALEEAPRFQPDAVLIDIGLPRMDGYEVVRRLRERLPGEVLLVALTGYGDPEHLERARAAGFHEYLTKPVSMERLRRLLGHR